MVRILGIDPSLNSTGWGIVDYDESKDKFELIDYGFLDVKHYEKEDEDKKLHYIYKRMSRIFSIYKPDHVIAESPFYSKNVDTLTKLAHTHGVLLLLSIEYSHRMKYYSPLTIKSVILGGIKKKDENGNKKTGKDLKKEVADAIFKIFPKQSFLKEYNDDVTDAISVTICAVKKGFKGFVGENVVQKKKKNKKE